MSDKQNESKLDTELAHSEITETCTPKFKLKFTDYAVDKFQANFIYTDKNGETKTRPRAYVPFDVSRHTILKGLKLVQYNKTKKKYFYISTFTNNSFIFFCSFLQHY